MKAQIATGTYRIEGYYNQCPCRLLCNPQKIRGWGVTSDYSTSEFLAKLTLDQTHVDGSASDGRKF